MSSPPSLFEGHRIRAIGLAALAAFGAHFVMGFIPNSLYSLNFTQTSVAMLAIATVTVLVVAHHRTQGQVMTQTQEELILIGAFGLFWLALLVALRALRQRGGDFTHANAVTGADAFSTVARPVQEAANAAGAPVRERVRNVYARRQSRRVYSRDPYNPYVVEEYVYY